MVRRYTQFAWGVLAYNIFVILWGAYVRASGSGAGCGRHWPLCNGEVVPRAPQLETMIEFAHRITSGLAAIGVFVLFIWAWRIFPQGHLARRGAAITLVFIIIESLLGAGLVLFGLVAGNTSLARAIVGGIHLINTLLLLGAITLTAWWAGGGAAIRLRGQGRVTWMLLIGLVAVLGLGASGAMTALGDTLFPSDSLQSGFAQDFDPSAHFLVRLRIWHPIAAIITGIYLLLIGQIISRIRPGVGTQRAATLLILLFVAQLGVGSINLVLLAPIALQIIHLLLADLVWVALVMLCVTALAKDVPIWVDANTDLIRC